MEVMRDIGSRIGRYRLSRYASPTDPLRWHLRWFWLAAVLWIVWAGLLSKGSFYRLWRLDAERQRIERELEQTRGDIVALEKASKDPRLKREWAERQARHAGMARAGEIIYRIRETEPPPTER
jgi:cell division protein FtsB